VCIDIFSQTDPDTLAGTVVTALLAAGIEVKDSRDAPYNDETKSFHKLIEFYIPVKR
jgi:hypothetical protein